MLLALTVGKVSDMWGQGDEGEIAGLNLVIYVFLSLVGQMESYEPGSEGGCEDG